MNQAIEDRAEGIRNQLTRLVKDVKTDKELTVEAKRDRITQAQNQAKCLMDDLRAEVKSTRDREQSAAASRLAGPGAKTGVDAISIRDATERAGRLETAKEARALLSRARANGDETLVRAVLFEARERSREGVFTAHWSGLLEAEGRGEDRIAADVREAGIGNGSPFESVFRFVLPSVSDLTYDVA